MRDIQKEDYAEWLESSLRQMVDFRPTRIAICATNAEATATAYWQCDASDKAQIAAVIQQDGLFDRIEANRDWLASLLEEEEEDNGQDTLP